VLFIYELKCRFKTTMTCFVLYYFLLYVTSFTELGNISKGGELSSKVRNYSCTDESTIATHLVPIVVDQVETGPGTSIWTDIQLTLYLLACSFFILPAHKPSRFWVAAFLFGGPLLRGPPVAPAPPPPSPSFAAYSAFSFASSSISASRAASSGFISTI
jgi:hypothetical protein